MVSCCSIGVVELTVAAFLNIVVVEISCLACRFRGREALVWKTILKDSSRGGRAACSEKDKQKVDLER